MASAFHLLTTAVLWTLIHFCSSELYDVTTIYRFDKPQLYDVTTIYRHDKPHEIRDTPIPEVKLPNIKDWLNSGWIETDSMKAFAHLPTSDREVLHTSWSNDLTEAIPVNWDTPFVLSTPQRQRTDVYVIFMTTKEIQFGDLVMLRMGNKSLSLNICKLLDGGTHYSILNDRQCRSIVSVDDTSEAKHYYFHRVQDRIVVSSPSSENEDGYFMTIPISYVEDKRYLRMGGPGREIFSSTKPKRVMALSTATGQLETGLTVMEPSVLCLEMTYLMRNYTGSRIELLLKDDYLNTDVNLGVVNGVNNKGEWSTHRFLTGVLQPDYPYKLTVEAHNEFGKTPIYIHNLQVCTEDGRWNATTFPISGREEIHALTNAIGRRFRLRNESIVGPVARSEAAIYPNPAMSFSWLLDGWHNIVSREEIMASSPKKYIKTITMTTENSGSSTYSVFNEFKNKLTLSVDNTRHFNYIVVYLMASSSFRDSNGFRIYFNGENLQIYSTRSSHYICNFPVVGSRSCNSICHKSVGYYNRDRLKELSITIQVRESHIYTKVMSASFPTVTCHSDISWLEEESKMYYSIEAGNMLLDTIAVHEEARYVLKLKSDEGKLVSPAVYPKNNQLCLAIVYYMAPNTTLTISATREDGKEFSMKTIQSKQISGWKEEVIKKDYGIFDNDLPVQFVVRGTREGASTLLVQELPVCDWNEDIMVLKQEAMLTVINSGVDVFEEDTKHRKNDVVTCMNGGVLAADGECACPPGFTGPVCEQGCGPNRYGDDCSGRCSASKEECRGMVLCRPHTGCDCAPGYKGYFCSQNCSENQFGAGCRQQCGYCRLGTCDRYTGECRGGCEPGYFPPLCQEKCLYLLTAPEVVRHDSGITVTVNFSSSNLAGRGSPHYYQIQYKLPESTWLPMRSDLIDVKNPVVTVNISNLRVNDFHVRAVIINEDGTTYQGDSIPVTEMQHECLVPEAADYHLKSDLIGQDSFHLTWKVPPTKPDWCQVSHYEVFIKEDWSWIPYGNTTNSTMYIQDRSPGEKYEVRVRAVTTSGKQADFSEPLIVRVAGWPLEQVRNLKIVSAESRTLTVSWDYGKPEVDGIQHYVVTYECLELISCPNQLRDSSSGQLQTKDFNITLRGLKPHAQYLVTVAPYGDTIGPSTDLLAITLPAGSQVKATMEEEPVFEQTNSSFSVRWAAPQDCSNLNGFFQGYHYRLRLSGEDMVLEEGDTVQTSAEFTNLTPLINYDVEVFVMTNGGWDKQYPLIIPASTSATTPGKVTALTVYKTARRMLGLRWGAPARTYGALKSFTVTYHETWKQSKVTTLEVQPTPCPAWPHLYCLNISRLRPDTRYTITVQARNVEVDQDGEVEEVEAITQEGAPSAPPYIQLVSQSNSSLSVKWGIPNMINGILRSFLVSIEEVDTYNISDCCQYFPMQELPVTEERDLYQLEVSGLRPASSYVVSVSAKTVALGPPANISAFTRPPTPHLPAAPTVILSEEDQQVLVSLEPVTYLQELVQQYLLLLMTDPSDEQIPEVQLWDLKFAEELKASLNRSFYLVAEFTQEDLIDSRPKVIEWNHSSGDGVFGHISVPSPSEEVTYTVVLVAVLEYQGAFSFSHRESEPFMVSEAHWPF